MAQAQTKAQIEAIKEYKQAVELYNSAVDRHIMAVKERFETEQALKDMENVAMGVIAVAATSPPPDADPTKVFVSKPLFPNDASRKQEIGRMFREETEYKLARERYEKAYCDHVVAGAFQDKAKRVMHLWGSIVKIVT